MSNLKPIIENSMIQYAGAVLQSRALVDVRDGLKPSARQIFYSMLLHKLTHDKPYKKTANAVGMALADFYIHGDSSCVGVIMRAGQPFAMRYPLVDVKGNAGSLIESGNWAAMRYTESRLSKILNLLFTDINKETISDWRDSYDNTKQYPSVLPSKGFYNICNGTMGIGIGMASSVPQYNLKEMNRALETLLLNPDCSFNDIYIAPDFATGAILLNESEVKESMSKGTGFACKLRSVVDYDKKENLFIVTEVPYGVYTNTICKELEKICNSDENPGIERFNDLTGEKPLIKIYLTKKANPDKVLTYLYKNTSLQSHYGINFTMLDNGRFPRVFTWKEMLQAHIDHEKQVYRRAFEFDQQKIKNRIHIINGLLKAYDMLDETITTIKNAENPQKANLALQKLLEIDETQAKAILDLKLSRLSKLDISKLKNEKTDLQKEYDRIDKILNDTTLFNNELIKGWREVAEKFGDERRTKIMDICKENDEIIEEKSLQICLTNKQNIYLLETSSLYTQRRGTVGSKLKLDKDEYIISTSNITNKDTLLFFTKKGDYCPAKVNNLDLETKISVSSIIPTYDEVCAITSLKQTENIIFITKKGILKKSLLSNYKTNRKATIKAIELDKDDEIVKILFTNNENIGVLTAFGYFLLMPTNEIRPIGRTARGVQGIKLGIDDYVVSAQIVPETTEEIISITGKGLVKRTINDFTLHNRGTKGTRLQKINEDDFLISFIPINKEKKILVPSNKSCLKIEIETLPLLSRNTIGVKAIKLKNNEQVVGIEIAS